MLVYNVWKKGKSLEALIVNEVNKQSDHGHSVISDMSCSKKWLSTP